MLDFALYQGANTLTSQVQNAERRGLEALVIAHLIKTKSIKVVDQMSDHKSTAEAKK